MTWKRLSAHMFKVDSIQLCYLSWLMVMHVTLSSLRLQMNSFFFAVKEFETCLRRFWSCDRSAPCQLIVLSLTGQLLQI